jgi:ribose transport system permease protein
MSLSLFHGWLVTGMGIQAFIVTLCGLLCYRGLARFVTNDETKGFGSALGFERLRFLAGGSVLGIPMPLILLIIISVVIWILLHRSVYGRYLFAAGRNEEAARYSGINTRVIITLAYVSSGALTAISGIIFAFYTNSVSPASHGNFYELYGIAAAVLGGCSLRGGEGSVLGILIGTALLQVLQNLVNLLGIPSSLNFAVMGAVILLGVLADQFFSDRGGGDRSSRCASRPRTTTPGRSPNRCDVCGTMPWDRGRPARMLPHVTRCEIMRAGRPRSQGIASAIQRYDRISQGVWEERWHPLREEWVIIAAHRQDRPWSGGTIVKEEKPIPRYVDDCYLCPARSGERQNQRQLSRRLHLR